MPVKKPVKKLSLGPLSATTLDEARCQVEDIYEQADHVCLPSPRDYAMNRKQERDLISITRQFNRAVEALFDVEAALDDMIRDVEEKEWKEEK